MRVIQWWTGASLVGRRGRAGTLKTPATKGFAPEPMIRGGKNPPRLIGSAALRDQMSEAFETLA